METQRILSVVALVACVIASGGAASAAATAPCPGNPDAIGVSRVLTVNARDHARLGLMQYRYSLPLDDHEVVLTFDDGPLPPYTDRVLDILARNCVKATFFLVGRHALANPDTARRVYDAGHTIGNHSQNHVLHFDHISEQRAESEIENGSRTLDAILGGRQALAPFFRIPGLGRTSEVEKYARARSLVVWSADAVADDWTRITANQVLQRALSRLEARKKGILLLHDIQPRTVLMLQTLLTELKKRHFRIVHVRPEGAGEAPAAAPALVASGVPPKLAWPRVASTDAGAPVRAKTLPDLSAPDTVPAHQPVVKTASAPGRDQPPVIGPEAVASIVPHRPAPPHKRAKARHHVTRTAVAAVPDQYRAETSW